MKHTLFKTVVAIICLGMIAVTSNATSFQWSGLTTGDIAAPGGGNLGAGDMTVFIWDTGLNGINASAADIAAGHYGKGDDVVVTQTSGTGLTTSNGRLATQTYTYTFGGSGATLTDGASSTHVLGASMAMNCYIIVFDGANLAGSTHYAISPVLNGTTQDEPSELNTALFTLNGNNILQGSWQVLPVPEPCSMALFGVGLAAMGLRRRFQKKS